MNSVQCKDCAHAEWVRTPKGNVQTNTPGRCLATPPPPVLWLARFSRDAISPPRKPAIWPDYQGPCDLFTKGEPS
jgi:hypothetical protein